MFRRLEEMYRWISAHPDSTERQIAEGVGLRKTPYSHQCLIRMMNDGWLICRVDETAPRPTNRYTIAPQDNENGPVES